MSKETKNRGSRFDGFESIRLGVTVSVGGTRCRLRQLSELKPGDVIDLDRRVGEPFELRAGGVRLARVEPVAHGEGIGVKLLEIVEDDHDARD